MKTNTFQNLWSDEEAYLQKLNVMYSQSQNSWHQRLILSHYYMITMNDILDDPRLYPDRHAFDWKINENERSLWSSIQMRPMAMYPEFPVVRWFVDFGNPCLKIALEADSKTHHERSRDTTRDEILLEFGWKTFRVSHEENFPDDVHEPSNILTMMTEGNESDALDAMERWMMHTSDGVVEAVNFFYFMPPNKRLWRIKHYPEYLSFATETLEEHRLVEFPLPEFDSETG